MSSNNESKNLFLKLFKFGITPWALIIVAFLTLISGATSKVLSSAGFTGTVIQSLFDIAFFVSLSLNIVQILLQQTALMDKAEKQNAEREKQCQECNMHALEQCSNCRTRFDDISKLVDTLKLPEIILWPKDTPKITNMIMDIVKNKCNNGTLHIICYGTYKYDGLLDFILDVYKEIKVKLVVCSPNVKVIRDCEDAGTISSIIHELQTYYQEQVEVIASEIFPTIRASALYDENNNPLWCCVQPYYYEPSKGRNIYRGYQNSPAIFGDLSHEGVLNNLIKVFDIEFKRLTSNNDETVTPHV